MAPEPSHGHGAASTCNGRQRTVATLPFIPLVRSRECPNTVSSGKYRGTGKTTEGERASQRLHRLLTGRDVANGRLDRRPFGVSAGAENG
jgi:hypothetical protein